MLNENIEVLFKDKDSNIWIGTKSGGLSCLDGIPDMVDQLNMSQSTLYRKIRSLTGLSLTAFIRSVRLKKAAALILTQDMSLNQISFEVGFNDYKYFTVSFKKQFNCLPSKYREKTGNQQLS